MKVLFYSRGLFKPNGGGETAANKMYKSILKQKENIEFYCLTNHKDLPPNKNAYNHPTFPINIPIFKFFIDNIFATLYLNIIADMINPDLIHIQGYSGYYPRPPENYKSLITFHDFPFMSIYDKNRKDPLKFIEFLWYEAGKKTRISTLKYFDYYHSLSSEITNSLIAYGIEKNRIFQIINGVDNESFRYENDLKISKTRKTRYIIMIGKIHYRKGVHLVVDALKHLPENYHLLLVGKPMGIIGNGYLLQLLKKGKSRIHYLGFLSNEELDKVIELSDCYISASIFEACQLSPLEALSKGMKVVTSNVGAISDIFPKNYCYIYEKNDPKIIAKMVNDACEKNNFELNPLEFHILTWDQVGEKLINTYNSIGSN